MPDISKITLPSGSTYDIKDSVARQLISGGVSFKIVWTQTDYESSSAPTDGKKATIPAGVKVYYNNGASYATGTLVANGDASSQDYTPGFYLIYSKTQAGVLDTFEEYVTVTHETNPVTYTWEKIGDTQIDLSNVVTGVTLNKQTDTVIGTDATFTHTDPAFTLKSYAAASGGTAAASGRLEYVESVTAGSATPTKKYLKATATGGAVSASGDNVTALTGLGTASTKSAIGADSTFTITQPTIALAPNNSSATGRVQLATGDGTTSSTNTDWLKGVNVTNEVLTIGAATHDTTYLGATASGANTAWNSKDAVTAVTGYASPTTDTVLGTASSFSVTNPSVAITDDGSEGTQVVTDIDSISITPTTKYIETEKTSSGSVAWNSKDQVTVLTNDTSITVTKGQ